jgi:hypothetical protein
MKLNEKEWNKFQEALEENMYFNMKGCESVKGTVAIPREWYYQILNWSGSCTDPNESEDYYKNPRAMFVALDLIYLLLDSINTSDKRSKEENK